MIVVLFSSKMEVRGRGLFVSGWRDWGSTPGSRVLVVVVGRVGPLESTPRTSATPSLPVGLTHSVPSELEDFIPVEPSEEGSETHSSHHKGNESHDKGPNNRLGLGLERSLPAFSRCALTFKLICRNGTTDIAISTVQIS